MKKLLYFVFVFVGFYPSHSYADSYVCVAEKSTGFHYNQKTHQWDDARFRTDTKYLIRKADQNDVWEKNHNMAVVIFGKKKSEFRCQEGINDVGLLLCYSLSGQFKFNNLSLRFLRSMTFGYYNNGYGKFPDKLSASPFLEIGTCTKM